MDDRLLSGTEALLKLVAERGELDAQSLLAHVPRPNATYLDFFPLATLLHAGYIATDSVTENREQKIQGKLGVTTQDTAIFLCQLTLKPGESFEINGCPRDSARGLPLNVFITAEGYVRLDELQERAAERRRKRRDYLVTALVAIAAAVLSSVLAHYFATERFSAEHHLSAPNMWP
jgi:hypothetical protein